MRRFDLKRPDRLLREGLRTLGSYGRGLYAREKADAKAKAELTFFGEQRLAEAQTQLFTYNGDNCTRADDLQTFHFESRPEEDHRHWLNIHGIHDVSLVEQAAAAASLDRLTIRQSWTLPSDPKLRSLTGTFSSISNLSSAMRTPTYTSNNCLSPSEIPS